MHSNLRYLFDLNFESGDKNLSSEDAGFAGVADGDVTFGPNGILQLGWSYSCDRVELIKNNLKK